MLKAEREPTSITHERQEVQLAAIWRSTVATNRHQVWQRRGNRAIARRLRHASLRTVVHSNLCEIQYLRQLRRSKTTYLQIT
jgi:hypothetical protein